jgi:hypothetical protein
MLFKFAMLVSDIHEWAAQIFEPPFFLFPSIHALNNHAAPKASIYVYFLANIRC